MFCAAQVVHRDWSPWLEYHLTHTTKKLLCWHLSWVICYYNVLEMLYSCQHRCIFEIYHESPLIWLWIFEHFNPAAVESSDSPWQTGLAMQPTNCMSTSTVLAGSGPFSGLIMTTGLEALIVTGPFARANHLTNKHLLRYCWLAS